MFDVIASELKKYFRDALKLGGGASALVGVVVALNALGVPITVLITTR